MTNACATDRVRVAANLRRIAALLDPPPPTMRDRCRTARYAVCEWWSRHLTQRELYRRFDAVEQLMALKRQRDGSPQPADPMRRATYDLSVVLSELDDGPI
ncbi:hypothetical protein [Streptomyces sp. HUAS TT20]|uniref:hypothetical protein n=1 Tax=Streptomyces sp. HUAS TT20 TaxID=3447509 RepID=UPI0021DA34F5|nr:hypothetical protein [Streptomyces sp. HUAS 15-9]UXY33016.1 hypothetical protein N8I87_42675 [Streptomyces sp. HUAS 15-9]